MGLRVLEGVYAYVGELPRGCVLCMQGVKMVIFVTGLCGDRCFYCPVSKTRLYHDVRYVDEEPMKSLMDALYEAYRIGADGASITGGDPLRVPERTISVIKLLKDQLGPDFHIHLYTSGRYATSDLLRELERAGLDEIRFHPAEPWERKAIERALRVRRSMRVGAEVPVIPGRARELMQFIEWLDKIGADFINLNELEVSPSNVERLLMRGIKVSPRRPVALGSQEEAMKIVRWAASRGLRITVHYCPAGYKDSVQMRLRLVRKALRTAKPYEKVLPSGMIASFETDEERGLLLAREGYGEVVGGRALLHPEAARLHGLRGVLRTRYPAGVPSALPSEEERVAEQGDNPAH